ncbi:unnamed protein product [Peniophora sp. CBMAI 1063]|nr:unnamed protein product [Peniophora sp. CBMAI 1063]
MADLAAKIKQDANELFKRRAFTDAANMYARAEQLAPNDPVYPSNLSAALFEAGDYAAAFDAIARSWSALSIANGPDISLALRLSARLARTISNGVMSGSLSFLQIMGKDEVVTGLRGTAEAYTTHASAPDALRAWEECDVIRGSLAGIQDEDKERSRRAFARLPVLKQFYDGATPEYYLVGHDHLLSILDDYGPDHPCPLDLKACHADVLSNLSFFFGGVGDARHVYSSIIGLGRGISSLSDEQRNATKVHLALSDIHPAMLCRDLVILMLLDLLRAQPNKPDELSIKAAIHYTFSFNVIPKIYMKWVDNTIGRLRHTLSSTPSALPPWLHVSTEAATALVKILDTWSPLEAGQTAENIMTVARHQPSMSERHASQPSKEGLARTKQMIFFACASRLENYGASMHSAYDRAGPDATREQIVEDMWYYATETLVPPKNLRDNLSATSELWHYLDSPRPGRLTREEAIRMIAASFSETYDHYGANPTFFDPISTRNNRLSFGGWTNIEGKDYLRDVVRYLEVFNRRFRLPPSPVCTDGPASAAFGVSSTFFEAVVTAWQVIAVMRSSGSARATCLPTKFTRMWLSNVPDYTHGLMSQIVFALPSLQTHRKAEIGSNCLLHTLSFQGQAADYCHTYTLLLPQDVTRYLNCRIDELDAQSRERIGWQSDDRILKALPLREDVTRWLTRVLVNILWPGDLTIPDRIYGSNGVRQALNLNAFVALLFHLRELGYPAHWLSDYTNSLLSNQLTSTVELYAGPLPIPAAYSTRRIANRQLWMSPWVTELKTTLSLAAPIIPFPVRDIRHDAVAIFEADPQIDYPMRHGLYSAGRQSTAPNIHLMILHPTIFAQHGRLIRDIRWILDGSGSRPESDQLAIITSPEVVSATDSLIRWRLRVLDYERMKNEEWTLVMYRFDTNSPVGKAMPSTSWKKYEESSTSG